MGNFSKEKLSSSAKIILENPETKIFISQISFWEIAIKYQIGKLPDFNVSLEDFISAVSAAGFNILPLKNEHLVTYFNCSYFSNDHRYPFDRLLIATADCENTWKPRSASRLRNADS